MNYMSVQSVAFQPRRPGFARGLDPCRGAAIVWLSLAAHLAAQVTTIFIDAYDTPASNAWNRATFTSAGTYSNLVDSKAAAIPAWVEVTTACQGLNANSANPPTGAAAEFAPAGQNQCYGSTTPSVAKVRGLDSDCIYSFTFYGSRVGVNDNRDTRFRVAGNNAGTNILATANNTSQVAVVPRIRPTAAGEIAITIDKGPANTSGYFYFLAMKIVGYPAAKTLEIDGSPAPYGAVVPSYGLHADLENGSNVLCSATGTVAVAEGIRARCAGYALYTNETMLAASGTTNVFSYTHAGYARLFWQWTNDYAHTFTAGAGGTVSTTGGWYTAGNTVTVTASTAVTNRFFSHWTGDVPTGQSSQATLVFDSDQPRSLTAVFGHTLHVTPTGGGAFDGSDWDNAFSNLQAAVDYSGGIATIRMKEGLYPLTATVTIEDAINLVVKGGYAGVGLTLSENETVITRAVSLTNRLVLATDSAVSFDTLTLTGGTLPISAHGKGLGCLLNGSSTIFTNCVLAGNSVEHTTGYIFYGGAIYADGGELALIDCTVTNNFINGNLNNAGYSAYGYGGAVYTKNAAVRMTGCTIARNYVRTRYYAATGGALGFENGTAVLEHCTFMTNYTVRSENYTGGVAGYGGTIYVSGATRFDLEDCTFLGGWNGTRAGSIIGRRGGLIYMTGASLAATISRSSIYNAGNRVPSYTGDSGSIAIGSGTLFMTNVLHGAGRGNVLEILGGTVSAVNCTFANATSGYGILQTSGGLALRNCIVWGNESGAYSFAGGTAGSFDYCFVQDAQEGIGNSTADPLFDDAVYFHVKSEAGVYSGGWFSGGACMVSDATSPTIDAGDPNAEWENEPQPNFNWGNVGYDANTAVASKSVLGEPAVFDSLMVYSYPATNLIGTSAWARGIVAHAGGAEDPTVYLVWGTNDLGTAALSDWNPNVRSLGAQPLWEVFSSQLTDLPSGKTIYYRFYATNSTGSVWSRPVASFQLPALPVISNDGASHVTRHTARLNGSVLDTGGQTPEVTIYYWLKNAAATSSVALGPQNGSFTATVSGLTLGTNYGYRVQAVNGAGSVTADVSFQTLSTDPIIRYVTPTGAGIADGTSWANAYSNLQEAVEECIYAGDMVCMQAGTYVRLGLEDANERSQCVIANAAGLTIRGGYAGTGSPGAFTHTPTILARNETALPYPYRRIIRAANSVLVLDSLTIARGAINESGNHGHGCYFASACDVTITNCIFASNGMRTSESRTYCGGAISSSGGTLAVVDSLLTNNILRVWTDNSFTYGGAIYSSGTAVTLERCIFSGNSSQSCYHDSQGGALCLISGSASISGCAFYTNTVVKHETHPTTRGYGGTLYAKGLSNLNVSDCKIIGGYSIGPAAKGGLVYLEGTSQKAAISRTVMVESGKVAGAVHSGSLYLHSGTLALTNVLRAATGVTNAVDVYGGTLTAVNVTIADSPGYGIWMGGGTATLKHAIIWGNSAGGVGGPAAGSLSATYSDIQDGVLSGTGNRSADPLFADNVCFHLYSRRGFYSGFFDGGTWIRTRIAGYGDTSPAIDVGDPADDCSLEPPYRGNIINLGAYGNTAVATKAYRPEAAVLILR